MDIIINWLGQASPWIQTISLVFGVIYMVMQILQHRLMWYADIITAGAALIVASCNFRDGAWSPLWAQVSINVYFIIMAGIGIFTWKKLSDESGEKMHIVRLTPKRIAEAVAVILIGAPLICFLLSKTNDPSPILDGVSLALCIVASWYLTCSHLETWYFWIAADIASLILYAGQDAWGMVALYACYTASSFIGIYHWKKNGVYVEA